MIFGPDGKSIHKSGDSYFTDEGYVHKSGSMYFGPNGQSATESGGMIFTNQGTITQSGDDMFFTPNGMYHRSGSMLFGPNGQSWTGVESVEDVKVVIMNDLASGNAGKKHDLSAKPLIPWDNSDGKPIELSNKAALALIALIGIGALLMVIFF